MHPNRLWLEAQTEAKMDESGGYLDVAVPNRPNAVYWYRFAREIPEIRRVQWCARQGLGCHAMCTCSEMERHVCTAVTALRGWFEVMEGATMTIANHMHRAVEKLYNHRTHQ